MTWYRTPLASSRNGRAMQHQYYTKHDRPHFHSWFNKRHGRINSLFGERYKAILIEKQAYFQRVVRYVILNPVRARMVERPEDYPWSSYCATAGLTDAPSWLSLEQLIPYFGEADSWRANYVAFVNEKCAANERIWNELRRRFSFLRGLAEEDEKAHPRQAASR